VPETLTGVGKHLAYIGRDDFVLETDAGERVQNEGFQKSLMGDRDLDLEALWSQSERSTRWCCANEPQPHVYVVVKAMSEQGKRPLSEARAGVHDVVACPAGLQPGNCIRSEPTALGFAIMPPALRYAECLISRLKLSPATCSGSASMFGGPVVVPRWSQKSLTSCIGARHFALYGLEFNS
jgi:hypothetical protein